MYLSLNNYRQSRKRYFTPTTSTSYLPPLRYRYSETSSNIPTTMLEPAIPVNLQRERTQPKALPADYNPPFPAYCARFSDSAKELVMVIIGAQAHQGTLDHDALNPITRRIEQSKDTDYFPAHWLLAKFIDKKGADNRVVISYWPNRTLYTKWNQETHFDSWWSSSERESEGHGWFKEVLFPSMDRLETVFSDNSVPEGCAFMSEKMSGPMQEHVYWGSSRDRLPVAQTDALQGEALQQQKSDIPTKRVKITGKSNLCIIRSGQDWSNTLPVERKLYLETMHPVLETGMYFLRDEGRDIGCYTCRFMSVLDPVTLEADKDKTFGLAFFNDLGSLENWSKSHKTHLDIFHRFLNYAQELNNNVSLRLFHEILVLSPDQQGFEYIDCHDDSGLLVCASS